MDKLTLIRDMIQGRIDLVNKVPACSTQFAIGLVQGLNTALSIVKFLLEGENVNDEQKSDTNCPNTQFSNINIRRKGGITT